MGTVLISTICHYCEGKATTEDHIVPRAALPKPMSRLPYWFRSNNVVPACSSCNNRKGCARSDCLCDHCTWAWKTAWGLHLILATYVETHVQIVQHGRQDSNLQPAALEAAALAS